MKKIDFSKKDLLFLAPLAGFSDLPFRKVVKKFGVDVTISEMISANAFIYHSKKTLKMIQKSKEEDPFIVQISGSNVDVIKETVLMLNDMEGIDGIDLNCGCPVRKVVKTGAGSGLLKDLKLMGEIIYTIKKYSKKQYLSVKSRLGFDKKIPQEIVKVVQENGANWIVFHGRTQKDMYMPQKIDYLSIAKAKEVAKIPVVANGDITSLEKANLVKKITNCDAIMIGRGAIGNPWLFYQIKHNLQEVKKEKIKEIVLEHFKAVMDFYGQRGVSIFRKHLHTYSKSFPNATKFREKVNKIIDPLELQNEIKNFFD